MQIKTIVDVGSQFGMSTHQVFQGWDNEVRVFEPRGLNSFVNLIPTADIVLFGGGEDIHPDMYGHGNHGSHVRSDGISMRDRMEREIFNRCVAAGIPILGICRGSQFACVMSGGSLFQNVTGHGQDHQCITFEGKSVMMNSHHHQMMYPDKVAHELLAWTVDKSNGRANFDYNKLPPIERTWFLKEPEVVFFPKTRALAVQPHPEWMSPESEGVKFVQRMIREKLMQDV